MALFKKMISKATFKSYRKKWFFKELGMFSLKLKQEKQRKTSIVGIFMECYALSANFMLFYDFDLKSKNFMTSGWSKIAINHSKICPIFRFT